MRSGGYKATGTSFISNSTTPQNNSIKTHMNNQLQNVGLSASVASAHQPPHKAVRSTVKSKDVYAINNTTAATISSSQ